MTKYLVVARFDENVDWTANTPSDWQPPFIVQKGEHLENTGREASSFFWGINSLYGHLDPRDLVACVQGDPFPHCPTLNDHLLVTPLTFYPLGKIIHCYPDATPHHSGLDLHSHYENWIGGTPPEIYDFTPGAQFIVPAEKILERPKEYYEAMVDAVSAGDGPWIMERLFPYVWP